MDQPLALQALDGAVLVAPPHGRGQGDLAKHRLHRAVGHAGAGEGGGGRIHGGGSGGDGDKSGVGAPDRAASRHQTHDDHDCDHTNHPRAEAVDDPDTWFGHEKANGTT